MHFHNLLPSQQEHPQIYFTKMEEVLLFGDFLEEQGVSPHVVKVAIENKLTTGVMKYLRDSDLE